MGFYEYGFLRAVLPTPACPLDAALWELSEMRTATLAPPCDTVETASMPWASIGEPGTRPRRHHEQLNLAHRMFSRVTKRLDLIVHILRRCELDTDALVEPLTTANCGTRMEEWAADAAQVTLDVPGIGSVEQRREVTDASPCRSSPSLIPTGSWRTARSSPRSVPDELLKIPLAAVDDGR
jgi:hypothetical protein